MLGAVVLREGHLRIGAVDRAGRGEHQVLHAVVPAALEHMQEAGDVALDIDVRIGRRIADPGLGGEIDHPLRPVRGEGLFHRRPVAEVDGQLGVVRMVDRPGQPSPLEGRIIVVVEAVDADDRVAPLQQTQTGGRTGMNPAEPVTMTFIVLSNGVRAGRQRRRAAGRT